MKTRIMKDKTGEKFAVGPALDKKFDQMEASLRDKDAISATTESLESYAATLDQLTQLEDSLADPMKPAAPAAVSKDDLSAISDQIEDLPEAFAQGDEETIRPEDLLVPASEIPDVDSLDGLLQEVTADAFGMPAPVSEAEVDDADLVDGPVVAEMAAASAPLPEGFTVLSAEDIARNRSSLEALKPATQEVAMTKTDKPDAIRKALTTASDWSDQVQVDPERLTALVLLGLKDRDTFPLLFMR